jgi:hypothetical protein
MVYLAQDYPLTTNQVVVNDMPLTSIVTANTNLAPGASYTFLNWDFPNHPTPTYGNFKFDFYLPYNVTPAAVGTYKWEVTVYINGVAASTTAAIQTIDQKSYTIPEHSTSVAGPVVESFVFSLSVPVQYYYSDLFQINAVFFASALNPGAVDVVFSGATAANVTPYLRWEDYTHGRWSISSPKQFIAFSGVNPGQTVAVDTVSNLALIPGPDLAKNVTSTLAPPNFNDFRNALAFVSLIGTPGTGKFRWVWRLDEYKDFINNYANVYSDRTNVSKILAFSLKDFIKDALPVAGAALGGIFLGPEGVGLGSRAGSMISNILSADEDCVKKRKVVHAAVETSIMDLSTIVANDGEDDSSSSETTDSDVDNSTGVSIFAMDEDKVTDVINKVSHYVNCSMFEPRTFHTTIMRDADPTTGTGFKLENNRVCLPGDFNGPMDIGASCWLIDSDVLRTKDKLWVLPPDFYNMVVNIKNQDNMLSLRLYKHKTRYNTYVVVFKASPEDSQWSICYLPYVKRSKRMVVHASDTEYDFQSVIRKVGKKAEMDVDDAQPKVSTTIGLELSSVFEPYRKMLTGHFDYNGGAKEQNFGRYSSSLWDGTVKSNAGNETVPADLKFNKEYVIAGCYFPAILLEEEQQLTRDNVEANLRGGLVIVSNIPVYKDSVYGPVHSIKADAKSLTINLDKRFSDKQGAFEETTKEFLSSTMVVDSTVVKRLLEVGAGGLYISMYLPSGNEMGNHVSGTSWMASCVAALAYFPKRFMLTGGNTHPGAVYLKYEFWQREFSSRLTFGVVNVSGKEKDALMENMAQGARLFGPMKMGQLGEKFSGRRDIMDAPALLFLPLMISATKVRADTSTPEHELVKKVIDVELAEAVNKKFRAIRRAVIDRNNRTWASILRYGYAKVAETGDPNQGINVIRNIIKFFSASSNGEPVAPPPELKLTDGFVYFPTATTIGNYFNNIRDTASSHGDISDELIKKYYDKGFEGIAKKSNFNTQTYNREKAATKRRQKALAGFETSGSAERPKGIPTATGGTVTPVTATGTGGTKRPRSNVTEGINDLFGQ